MNGSKQKRRKCPRQLSDRSIPLRPVEQGPPGHLEGLRQSQKLEQRGRDIAEGAFGANFHVAIGIMDVNQRDGCTCP